MKKKIAALAFAGASLGMFVAAPQAGAAHCTVSPSEHVQAADHNEGKTHLGWSTCAPSANQGASIADGDQPGRSGDSQGKNAFPG